MIIFDLPLKTRVYDTRFLMESNGFMKILRTSPLPINHGLKTTPNRVKMKIALSKVDISIKLFISYLRKNRDFFLNLVEDALNFL